MRYQVSRIGMPRDERPKCPQVAGHLFAEVLAAVGRQYDAPKTGRNTQQLGQPRRLSTGSSNLVQGIDNRVAGQGNGFALDALGQQRPAVARRSGEVPARQPRDQPAVHLLRERMPEVAGPQAGLDVAHAHAAMKGGERGAHRGRRVALNHHAVIMLATQDRGHAGEHFARDVGEGLSRRHDLQIKIGLELKEVEHPLEQFAMLRRDAEVHPRVRPAPEGMHHRRQFDGLRPRPDHDEGRHAASSRTVREIPVRRSTAAWTTFQ